jgi:hypothetical protein
MIELKFAELHNPLFLGGKNHQLKLDPAKEAGLKLEYDRAEKELIVTYSDGKTTTVGIIPSSNVACMVPGKVEGKAHSFHPIVAGMQSAQVDSPMAHVHAGPGKGQTGFSGKVK